MKIAVVLFNLGGPAKLDEVKTFLFNLFNDKNILTLPQPFRWLLAKTISTFRANKAKKLYQHMGGSSPILAYTKEQAAHLSLKLEELDKKNQYEIFIAMRHAAPYAEDAVEKIKQYAPDEIILLPLYPQYSTTTTKSSFEDFMKKSANISAKIKTICCYPKDDDFIKAHQELIIKTYEEKIVDRGDPYQWQIERSVEHIMNGLGLEVEHLISYQSKVGKIKWLEPETSKEIIRAAKENKALIIVPIAFVSDHLETLVELDIDYKQLADELKIVDYHRVPALAINGNFIKSLAKQTIKLVNNEGFLRICPKEFCCCFLKSKDQ
jgi:ferrochelatase